MKNLSYARFFSGLSGLQLNIPKYQFPELFQKSSRLTYYSSLFNSIEINSSFYKTPLKSTIEKWAASVNNDFCFSFKLGGEVTHNKVINFNKEFVSNFFSSIAAVKEKKGCLLIQFPPSVGKEWLIKVKTLLEYIKEIDENKWRIAVEFRNRSWYNEDTYALLDFYKVGLVIHDISKSATPTINQELDFIYLRFHGPTGNYRNSYTEDFLMEYATYIKEWRSLNKTVYVYFNNTMGDAFQNLISLNAFVMNNPFEK